MAQSQTVDPCPWKQTFYHLHHCPIMLFNILHLGAVWPEKNCQMSINVATKMISLEKWSILTTLQKLPKNVGDLGKLIVAKGFEKLPKVQ